MHVHLDNDACLEVSVLKGPRAEVRASADAVTSERGVRQGHVHVIPVEGASGDGQGHHGGRNQPPRDHSAARVLSPKTTTVASVPASRG
jgi:CopG family nickel-responsive transcriptional regulator